MYVGDDAIDVGIAVAGRLRPAPPRSGARYRPLGWRSARRTRPARRVGARTRRVRAASWRSGRRMAPRWTRVRPRPGRRGMRPRAPRAARAARAHGVRVVDDGHADALARLREVAVEQRILHAARDRVERHAARRDVRAAELPVAEVSGDERSRRVPARRARSTMLPARRRLEQREHLLARVATGSSAVSIVVRPRCRTTRARCAAPPASVESRKRRARPGARRRRAGSRAASSRARRSARRCAPARSKLSRRERRDRAAQRRSTRA